MNDEETLSIKIAKLETHYENMNEKLNQSSNQMSSVEEKIDDIKDHLTSISVLDTKIKSNSENIQKVHDRVDKVSDCLSVIKRKQNIAYGAVALMVLIAGIVKDKAVDVFTSIF